MKHLTLTIDGMSCGHCLHAVSRELGAAPGVEVETVQLGRAVVRFDEATTSAARIADLVTAAGYPATPVGETG